MKNSEILKFVSDQLGTKNMCKKKVKKLYFVIMYVLGRHNSLKKCMIKPL